MHQDGMTKGKESVKMFLIICETWSFDASANDKLW